MNNAGLPRHQRGKGPTVVVIPGLAGRTHANSRTTRWFRTQEIRLLARRRAVWCLDRRFGLESGMTIAELAKEYATEIRDRFDGPTDIVGVSTGGSIALQLALDAPELVRRLVLVSSAHTLGTDGREIQKRTASLLRQGRPRAAAGLFLGSTAASDAARILLSAVGAAAPALVVGRDDGDLLVTLDAEDGFDIGGSLGHIGAPTLIVAGRRDRFYSESVFRATDSGLPDSRLTIYPLAGHVGLLSNRRLARDILEFLDGSTAD